MNEDINTLRRILKQGKTIAVVGLSANWWRPSYFAAKYMQEHGYRIIPVNPQYREVLGEKCYANLRDIPEPARAVFAQRMRDSGRPCVPDAPDAVFLWDWTAFVEGRR